MCYSAEYQIPAIRGTAPIPDELMFDHECQTGIRQPYPKLTRELIVPTF